MMSWLPSAGPLTVETTVFIWIFFIHVCVDHQNIWLKKGTCHSLVA